MSAARSAFASPFAGYTTEACRARIRARNDELNAVLRVLDVPQADALAKADAPLARVPYVLKDTWDTAGIVTTGGSWRHRERVPAVSSHAHLALAAAGAVLLGKSNLCDLAFSAESDNHMCGPVRNPYDPTRTAGGSTGGGAAAVADGMAAFDWGTDFGGSIRAPSGFCGIVGLRLSHAVWPVGMEHFPRVPAFFHDFCGMGPLTKSVAGARTVTHALAGALRDGTKEHVAMEERRVLVYAPDRAHAGEWATFTSDTTRLLDKAGIAWAITHELPTPTEINALFTEYLAAHFDTFIASEELPLRQALPAVLLALLTGGRFDKRLHRNTAVLFAGSAGLSLHYRDRGRADAALADLRARTASIWERGTLIVTPTCTTRPPKHGGAAWAYRLLSFVKLGNMVDATGLALPFGSFAGAGPVKRWGRWSRDAAVSPPMPRSLQILGPPGSENAVLDLAERLEAAQS